MRKMVIQCLPDGRVQHTLKDSFFKPFQGQHRAVQRLSEIEFDEGHQAFLVKWKLGPLKGYTLSPLDWSALELGKPLPDGAEPYNNLLLFDTYENAVAAEIAVVEKLRERGVVFS